jgi:aminoglycoside phosphotransferase family enzyme
MWELLDFYKCYRAMVRAKVNGLRLEDRGLASVERARLQRQIRRLLDLALKYTLGITTPRRW